jgi:hypothetical protein
MLQLFGQCMSDYLMRISGLEMKDWSAVCR